MSTTPSNTPPHSCTASSIARLMSHHPVFLRREAAAVGIEDGVLRRAVRDKTLVRVRQGVYADGEWWRKADSAVAHAATAQAAYRMFSAPVVFSHVTAAALYGIPLWGMPMNHLHVTHLGPAGGRTQGGIVHHRSVLAGDDARQVDGLPVTSPARTVIDCIRAGNSEAGLVVANGALHMGLLDERELALQARRQDRDPSTLRVRVVLRRADRRIASVGESRSHHLFITQGLPRPEVQFEVHDWTGALIGIVDFAWPEYGVIVEFDGRVKYSTLLRDGETPADAVVREKLREDRIREATGWTVIRLTWDDLSYPERTATRIRRAMRLDGTAA